MRLTEEQKNSWDENGYLILKSFFSKEKVEQINDFVESLWDNRHSIDKALVCDIFLDSKQQRVHLKNAPEEALYHPHKLNDLYLEYDIVRDMVLDVDLSQILSQLLGGTPLACNSLNFKYGSQQRDHFDTFYMPPRVTNKMLATWIALDPITKKNGPLRYYPQSHKIAPYLFSNQKTRAIEKEMHLFDQYINPELAKRNIVPHFLNAQAGDVFIWHAQLYHGGTQILDTSLTRRSLVTHYFRVKDYFHRFWRLSKFKKNGYYYKRKHQRVP